MRSKNEDKEPIRTACENLIDMLSDRGSIRTRIDVNQRVKLDVDTNELLRASLACQLGLFKSPLSTGYYTSYVNKDVYEAQVKEVNTENSFCKSF